MTTTEPRIFTIGHSNHAVDDFILLLQQHSITAVADVRSTPYSGFASQFNREALKRELGKHGLKYVFLGRELGARSGNPECYENGRVQYARLARTETFCTGIERVLEGARLERIVLMCTEKDPLECHRTVLVARDLTKRGVVVGHILASGLVESHGEAMRRLLDKLKLPHADLLHSTEELIEVALARQEERIAYVDSSLAVGAEG